MIQIMPNLHFNGNCRHAIELYKKAFGAEVRLLLSYADANPKDFIMSDENQHNLVYHSEIVIGDHRIMLNDTTGDDSPKGGHLSLLVHFDTEDEIFAAYEALSEGAVIISPMESQTYCAHFASLIDKYGIRWDLMEG